MRLTDPLLLHKAFRDRVRALDSRLGNEGIPLAMYEGARTPWRQQALYDRHPRVTRARPWESFHQYGTAADFVFFVGGKRTWSEPEAVGGKWTWSEPETGMWLRYAALAEECGLDVLSFERPHVQLRVPLGELRAGAFPPDGGATWQSWLGEQIELWWGSGLLGAPPPFDIDTRPSLAAGDA